MDIFDIFTVSELYDNIVNRLSIYDKINLYDVATFIKNKDERIFVKNKCSEKDRNILLCNPHISDLGNQKFNKLILFFDKSYENKSLDLSSLQINELVIDGSRIPIILFPQYINKLVATEYPYKIDVVNCHYGKFGYVNRHMIENCTIIKIKCEDSYAILNNKKVNKIKLYDKPDILEFINKYYSFDTLNTLSTCSSFILNYYDLSRDLIGKITGNLYVSCDIVDKINVICTNSYLKNLIICNDVSHMLISSNNTKITKIYTNKSFNSECINVFNTNQFDIELTHNLDIFMENHTVNNIIANKNIVINHAICPVETYTSLMLNDVRVLIYEPSEEITEPPIYNSTNFVNDVIRERANCNYSCTFPINYLLTRNGRIPRSYPNVNIYEIEHLTDGLAIYSDNRICHSKDSRISYCVTAKILIIPYKCRMYIINYSSNIKIIYTY